MQAQAVLAVVPRKSARVVAKTLKSAMANAEESTTNAEDRTNDALWVKEAVARNGHDH